MITVKFLGGAKKSFHSTQMDIDKEDHTIQSLIYFLLSQKPQDTPELDFNNMLVAINGIDSSALQGNLTKLQSGDVISIIPIIHGGSSKKLEFHSSNISIIGIEIKGKKDLGISFLDNLRKKYPLLSIQGISENFILNQSHLKKIVEISLTAKKNNILLSKKLEIDILLRFAGTSQISEAIKIAGVIPEKNFVIIAIGKKPILDKLCQEIVPLFQTKFLSTNNTRFLKKQFKITTKALTSINSKSPLEDILVEKAAILF